MLENDNVGGMKYQILVNGNVVAERGSAQLAEAYAASLQEQQNSNVEVRPVTSDGRQMLLD